MRRFARPILLGAIALAGGVLAGCESSAVMDPSGTRLYWGAGISADDGIGYAASLPDFTTVAQSEAVGSALHSAASTPGGSQIYVGYANGEVRILRTSDFAVVEGPVSLGSGGISGSAVTPDGALAVFSSIDADTVYMTDRDLGLLATTGLDLDPRNEIFPMLMAPTGDRVYILDTYAEVHEVTLDPLRAGRTFSGTSATESTGFSAGLALTTDGTRLYMAVDRTIMEIDAATMRETRRVRLGDYSLLLSVLVSPDGGRLYAFSGIDAGSVAMTTIDTRTMVPTSTQTLSFIPNNMWVLRSPDGTRAYVGNDGGPSLTVHLADRNALTVGVTGSGRVLGVPGGIDCPTDCAATYLDHQEVVLTAAPAPGHAFGSWSGACSGTGSTCTVAMSEVRSVGAEFTPLAPTSTGTRTATRSAVRISRVEGAIGPDGIVVTAVVRTDRPGRLTLAVTPATRAGRTGCRAMRDVRTAGTMRIACRIDASMRRRLARGALRLGIAVRLADAGGTATATRMLVLPSTPLPPRDQGDPTPVTG